jgi:hypothetical protein
MKLLVTLTVVFMVPACFAQDKCEQFPQRVQIRGLYLHQTLASATHAVPEIKIKSKTGGLSNGQLTFRRNSSRSPNLKDIVFIKVEFLDNKLYSVSALYRPTDLWQTSEDFVTDIAQKLGLPHPIEWVAYDADTRVFSCGDDMIMTGIRSGFPSLILVDAKAVSKAGEREKAAAYAQQELQEAIRDEKRGRFKP